MVGGKRESVVRGDFSRCYRDKCALLGYNIADHIDEKWVVFTLNIELDGGVVGAEVIRDQRYIGELNMTLIHSRMHRDAMGTGTDAYVDRAQQIGIVSPPRISQKGVFINVDG